MRKIRLDKNKNLSRCCPQTELQKQSLPKMTRFEILPLIYDGKLFGLKRSKYHVTRRYGGLICVKCYKIIAEKQIRKLGYLKWLESKKYSEKNSNYVLYQSNQSS